MQITIQMRDVYGEPKAYPADASAEAFAAIAGTKTLTRRTLREVVRIGIVIVELDRYGRECARHDGGNVNLPATLR
jgi:hypothetical protein